jgi:hypothetical protein
MLLSQQRARRRVVPSRFGPNPSPGNSPTLVIPYDYAASFELRGIPGNLVQAVVNISPEGVFVAVAIGYGFDEDRGRSLGVIANSQGGQPSGLILPADVTLGKIPPNALIEGFRINPRFHSFVFEAEQPTGPGARGAAQRDKRFSDQPLSTASLIAANIDQGGEVLFEGLKPTQELSFLFSIVDSGTGRELQDEPTHNLASLGKSNGERPFRLLAQPLSFLPRSTIRFQVVERSEGVKGTLFIVLYGYKILAGAGCPEPMIRSLRSAPAGVVERPSERVVPFDYVARLELVGRPTNIVEAEIPINVEGGFMATALGYGLAEETRNVPIQWDQAAAVKDTIIATNIQTLATAARKWLDQFKKNPATAGSPPTVPLAQLPLRLFPTTALTDGIRIRPNFLRIAFRDDGDLSTALPVNLIDNLFEPLNRPEDVSFRYTIFNSGTGRELQNQPIHNIAGLGIANGDRPFKKFARPMMFFPRSTIRVTVEEHFGRGSLFLVFQGYKVLGTSSIGVRR